VSSNDSATAASEQTRRQEVLLTRRERRAAERAASDTSEWTIKPTDPTSKTWSELREAVLLAESAFRAAGTALHEAKVNERRVESEALHARLTRGVRSKLDAPPQLVRSLVSLRSTTSAPDDHAAGPFRTARSVAPFTRNENASPAVSAEYEAAELLVHLAVAVSASDGRIVEVETSTLMAHIQSALGLSEDERARLTAHAQWCESATVDVATLASRMAQLTSDQRSILADLLLRVAASDRILAPEEDMILTNIFRFLGEDPATVAQRVNAQIGLDWADKGRQADDDQPSTVRRAPPPVPGQTIPRPPASMPAPIQTQPPNPPSSFVLDHRVIESTLRSTSLVSELLREIFSDDAEVGYEEVPRDSSEPAYAGLDAAHSRLLTLLAAHPELPRMDFDALARTLDVLPGGAIDTLNEAALDTTDEQLIEGDDPLVVSLDVLQEMMK
jgi:uncharacterized tellurite resistance protein B-like protein